MGAEEASKPEKRKPKRIGVIVVHGVGEQKRFEFLESIACSLYRAVRFGSNHREHPYIQLRRGDQVPHLSPEESWREAPAIVSWRSANDEDIEVRFREVHWADLDMEMTWGRWFKLVGWSLGISGVGLYNKQSRDANMLSPKALKPSQRFLVRLQLFGVSLLFLLSLITIDLAYGLITRFGFRAVTLGKARGIIYNYLGDVKLYQDWFIRNDDRLEVLGEKSRVAIRRRMVRALAQTASETKRKDEKGKETGFLDGYFIWSHSLGTVVAFNALMEPDLALPNYFTHEEWDSDMCEWLKTKPAEKAPSQQMPVRPPWLDAHDAMSREKLFSKFKGFLTMGSPLDKFAALWPSIVLENSRDIPGGKPWINVADVQDIVAGRLNGFSEHEGKNGEEKEKMVGGLVLSNIEWAGELTLLSAHTSYWREKRGKTRLIDCLVPWIETDKYPIKEELEDQLGKDGFNKTLMKCVYWLSFPLLGLVALLLASSALWLLGKASDILEVLTRKAAGFESCTPETIRSILCDGSYWSSVACWALLVLVSATVIVFVSSRIRSVWETRTLQTKDSGSKASPEADNT